MATVCSFCGQELPRDGDARFCTHCGKSVPQPVSASPDAQVIKQNTPLAHQSKTPLNPNLGWHEQLAKQPPARTAQTQQDAGVTPWLGLPEQDAGNVPPTDTSFAREETQQEPDVEELATLPFTPSNPHNSASEAASQIEDFPTSIMSSSSPAAGAQIEDLPTSSISVRPSTAGQIRRDRQQGSGRREAEDIEQMPTSQIAIPRQGSYASRAVITPKEPVSSPGRLSANSGQSGISLDGRSFGTRAAGMMSRHAPRKQKRSLLVGIIAAVVILLLGVGCWIILAQPFTVSANTDPIQTTTSSALGLAVAYPAGWTATQTSTALTLADSSNTAQMKIVQSASANTNQTGYLNQQASKLGMTDAKAGATISFGGSSWQQIHGDYVTTGVGYIGTIYATTHNGHLYTLTQIAPKVTFQDEESLIFAPARASLKFT